MNETFDPITLILIVAAIVVFFKLRGVLGQKTGHQEPFDPFDKPHQKDEPTRPARREQNDDNVITMPTGKPRDTQKQQTTSDDAPSQNDGFAAKVAEITQIDNDFDLEKFLTGARSAYEMIVVAFAQADKSTLKNLLSKDVFTGFSEAIDARKKQGAEMTTQFIGLDSATISKIELEKKRAMITVEFDAELVSFVRDKSGDIIEGDEHEVQEIHDIWAFERDLSSNDPNWLLVATDDD